MKYVINLKKFQQEKDLMNVVQTFLLIEHFHNKLRLLLLQMEAIIKYLQSANLHVKLMNHKHVHEYVEKENFEFFLLVQIMHLRLTN